MKKNTFDRACFVVRSLVQKFGLPMVVKAATQGSSIGTYIVKKEEEILPAIEAPFNMMMMYWWRNTLTAPY